MISLFCVFGPCLVLLHSHTQFSASQVWFLPVSRELVKTKPKCWIACTIVCSRCWLLAPGVNKEVWEQWGQMPGPAIKNCNCWQTLKNSELDPSNWKLYTHRVKEPLYTLCQGALIHTVSRSLLGTHCVNSYFLHIVSRNTLYTHVQTYIINIVDMIYQGVLYTMEYFLYTWHFTLSRTAL